MDPPAPGGPAGAPGAPGPARPLVDPEEYGEVDTSRYPEPKEATHRVRGRSDVLELLCGAGAVDPELLTVKTFYFFFYSAFGSLFPLMGVYFKQMGMNAGQCGLLIGTRPFVEFLAAPFWGGLADRWRKGRTLLLASLAAWIVFTLPLSWVQPGAVACVLPRNATAYELVAPRYDGTPLASAAAARAFHGPSTTAAADSAGSPLPVSDAVNYSPAENAGWVTPLHSSIVYRTADIQKTFFLLLLLVMLGEFFSAPAITLADSAVITLLGEDVRAPAHVRLAGLGARHVLRGHRAGPQHGVQRAPVRRPTALREELHHLLRYLLCAHGRRAAHRRPDQIQIRVCAGGGRAGGTQLADARGETAAAAGGAAAAAGAGHGGAARAAATAGQGVRADHARNARVGHSAASVSERARCLLSLRRLVHGLRHRPYLHFPLLALAGHRRLSDAVRRRVRHQPHLGDLRLLLQLQVDHSVRPLQGAVPGAGGQRAALPVHLVAEEPVVGAAVRVRAGRDARGRVGGVLLVHRAPRAARPALVGAGRAPGPAPRARARLRRRAGRAGRGALGHHAHLRRLRAAVRRGADRLRLPQLPRRGRRRGRRGRGGARRGRGRRAGAARRALQPAAARALLHAPARPGATRLLRRHAELRRRGEPERARAGARAAPRQPVPVGRGARRARRRLQISAPVSPRGRCSSNRRFEKNSISS